MSLGNVWLGQMQAKTLTAVSTLSIAAFSMETTALSVLSVLDRAVFKATGGMTETLTIALRPNEGTQYCTVIYRTSTSGYTSFFYQPDRPLFLYPGDQLVTTVSAGNTTGTVYGDVLVLY